MILIPLWGGLDPLTLRIAATAATAATAVINHRPSLAFGLRNPGVLIYVENGLSTKRLREMVLINDDDAADGGDHAEGGGDALEMMMIIMLIMPMMMLLLMMMMMMMMMMTMLLITRADCIFVRTSVPRQNQKNIACPAHPATNPHNLSPRGWIIPTMLRPFKHDARWETPPPRRPHVINYHGDG